MERLVEWNCKEKNYALPKCINEWGDVVPLEDICAQLATIYDILGDCDLDRLRELVEADKAGRCVILPKEEILKKGDRIWYVDAETGDIEGGHVFAATYINGKLESFSVDFDEGDFDEFMGSAWGDCFFGTKRVAEAALFKRRKDNDRP